MDIKEQYLKAREAAYARQRANNELRKHYRTEEQALAHRAHVAFVNELLPAKPVDYGLWLGKYLRNGGVVTNYRDQPMPGGWYVVDREIEVPNLCGALAVNLIVLIERDRLTMPNGVGHNELYFMEDGSHYNVGYVVGYSNVEPI
jgi:hypothetical protein